MLSDETCSLSSDISDKSSCSLERFSSTIDESLLIVFFPWNHLLGDNLLGDNIEIKDVALSCDVVDTFSVFPA